MIMLRIYDNRHTACGKLMSCPISGSYRWFRLKDHLFDHATCAEPDHHRHPQVNTRCRSTGFTILLSSVTSVGIWHTFATLGDPPRAQNVEAPLRRGRGWANAAYRDDARFGNGGGGAAGEGPTTRSLGSCMASCDCWYVYRSYLLPTPNLARKRPGWNSQLLAESSSQDLEFAKNRAIDKLCLGRYGRFAPPCASKG